MLSCWCRRLTTVRTSLAARYTGRFSSKATTKTVSSSAVPRTVALVSVSLLTGYALGRMESSSQPPPPKVLPSGLPRTCCEHDDEKTRPLTSAQRELIPQLQSIVGNDNVLSSSSEKRSFETGMRLGQGEALCVVTPRCLEHVKKCLPWIVKADCTILVQGANTGLTGGSVPRSSTADRPTVIISTQYLDTIFPLDGGKRVVCLAGAGLASLARFLETHFPDRESYSTLGSTCLDPTCSAGVALGSGGTQCRKGSAYTDRALYLKLYKDKWGDLQVQVVNTLGIAGIEDEDFYTEGRHESGNVLQQLDHYCRDVRDGYKRSMAKSSSSHNGKAKASDTAYAERLCVDDDSVSRYNADVRGLIAIDPKEKS